MNLILIKAIFCLALMIVYLIMASIIKDVVNSQLLASLAIITGAFTVKYLSPKIQKK